MRHAALFAALLPGTLLPAQIPDGWYVYGAFSPSRGAIGIFISHPRTPGAPTAITNLQGDLTVTGSSCILYRESDGAILVGERSPTGASVDLHVIRLQGTSVLVDASFSVGTGGPCCGEIPQMALLPDDRVVLAATDLSAGPLQNYLTTSYGWQGVGIVDTRSGLITPIRIDNGSSIADVFNGLALAPDGSSVYLGTYVSGTRGDIWNVPITGGTASLVATVPAGLSNLGFDAAGELWVTTLDARQGLFRVDVDTGTATPVPQSNGSLNAISYEEATGHFAVLSANSGQPPRSVFWMEPSGREHLLANPGFGILSGIAINPDPELLGTGTPGSSATYGWQMPNPGGLPEVGNGSFGLTVEVNGTPRPGFAVIATARAAQPIDVLGATVYLDPSSVVLARQLLSLPMTVSLPIPNDPSLVGASLFVQTFHPDDPIPLAATPAVRVSVL